MMIQDEESQIYFWPPDEKPSITNKDRFRAQREASGVYRSQEQELGSRAVNKRIPRMINIAEQLRNLGVSNPDAWINDYKKEYK